MTRKIKKRKWEVNKSSLTVKTYHVSASNETEAINKVTMGKGKLIDTTRGMDTQYQAFKL